MILTTNENQCTLLIMTLLRSDNSPTNKTVAQTLTKKVGQYLNNIVLCRVKNILGIWTYHYQLEIRATKNTSKQLHLGNCATILSNFGPE